MSKVTKPKHQVRIVLTKLKAAKLNGESLVLVSRLGVALQLRIVCKATNQLVCTQHEWKNSLQCIKKRKNEFGNLP